MSLSDRNDVSILRLYCLKWRLPFHQLTGEQLRIVQNTLGFENLRFAVAIRNLCREVLSSLRLRNWSIGL